MQHAVQYLMRAMAVPPCHKFTNSMKKMKMNYIVNSTIIWVYNLFYRTVSIVAQNSIGSPLIFRNKCLAMALAPCLKFNEKNGN